MNNPMQQPHPQAPPQVPTVHHPQLPADQNQYPYGHSVYFCSPAITAPPTPQSLPSQAPQSQAPPMYNTPMGHQHMPQYMPPANKNMMSNNHGHGPTQGVPAVRANYPVNYQAPGQVGSGGPAPHNVPANAGWNPTPSSVPQTSHLVAANNHTFNPYLLTTPSPAGRQTPGQFVNTHYPAHPMPRNMSSRRPQTPRSVNNSTSPNQYVPTSVPAGAHSGPNHASPGPQCIPPQMQPTSNPIPRRRNQTPSARRPSQDSASSGQENAQNYAQIIGGCLLPEGVRPDGQQAAGPRSQSSNSQRHFTDGGHGSQFTNPTNATYRSPHQTKPVPKPMAPATRYNLPTNVQAAHRQSIERRTATPPVASNGIMPQGGSVPPRSSVPPPASSMPSPASSMPPPAQQQPAMNTGTKRAAAQAPSHQTTKRQRKSTPASAVQQAPVAPVQHPAPVAPAQQAPTTATNANPVIYDQVAPLPPTFAPEPMHLLDWELAKINTSYMVEPDTTKPRPEGKTVLAWEQVIDMIVALIQQHCKKGQLLRPTPLNHLRELSDSLEEFIARPGRHRDLIPAEAQDLLNVRYVRVIEDGIWDGMFDRIPDRDHDSYVSTRPEDKERVVREAWEKRRNEYQGPSLEEAQRQIFKWDQIPGFGNVPARAESEPEGDSEPRPPRRKPKPWWLQGL